jgi:hypothetical protein
MGLRFPALSYRYRVPGRQAYGLSPVVAGKLSWLSALLVLALLGTGLVLLRPGGKAQPASAGGSTPNFSAQNAPNTDLSGDSNTASPAAPSAATPHVTINGVAVEVPENGTVQKTVTGPNGTEANVTVHNQTSSDSAATSVTVDSSTSTSSTSTHVNARSSSNSAVSLHSNGKTGP